MHLSPWLKLIRPIDWSKNSFVFAGLLFSHRWTDPLAVERTLEAFIAFCFAASCIYIFNDIIDRNEDARHPLKKNRPIASGTISLGGASILLSLLLILALITASMASWMATSIVGTYIVMNIAYTLRLKHVALLDVFIIATGFVLRILAGTVGVDIAPSKWVILCGLTLSLFLGFCKRYAELRRLGDDAEAHRSVLAHYSKEILEQVISICAACTIMTYSIYTVDESTVAIHGTTWMIATTPFVLYGILRYIYRLHAHEGGGRPVATMAQDPHLVVTVFGWLGTTLWLIA